MTARWPTHFRSPPPFALISTRTLPRASSSGTHPRARLSTSPLRPPKMPPPAAAARHDHGPIVSFFPGPRRRVPARRVGRQHGRSRVKNAFGVRARGDLMEAGDGCPGCCCRHGSHGQGRDWFEPYGRDGVSARSQGAPARFLPSPPSLAPWPALTLAPPSSPSPVSLPMRSCPALVINN